MELTKEQQERSQTASVLRFYRRLWASREARQLATSGKFPDDKDAALEHAMWMCEAALSFLDAGDVAKASRWLGFVQATLWACGHFSIDDMRAHVTSARV